MVSSINSGGVAEGNAELDSNLYFGMMFTGSVGEFSGFPSNFNVDLFSHGTPSGGSPPPTDPNSMAVGWYIGNGTQSFSANISPNDFSAVILGGLFDDSTGSPPLPPSVVRPSVFFVQ